MILIDTSAWIEFLRDTGSPVCRKVDALLGSEIAVCDPVRMEVLAGARGPGHLTALRGLLARGVTLPTTSADYETAAALYRICRQRGGTVRKFIDCLIAAVAIASDCPILHSDTDFETLAKHTALRTASP